MFQFRELSDNEIKEYMDKVFSDDEEYQKIKQHEDISDYYIKTVENAEKKFHSIENGFGMIKTYVQKKDYDESYNRCITLSNRLLRLAQDLRVLPTKFGCSNELTQIAVADDKYNIEFNYLDKGILHIVLPDVLPHRLKINDDKHIAMQDYSYNKQRMYNAFAKEFERGKFKVYDDTSVVLYYLNVFKDPRFMIDVDNIDTKIITDIISAYMLIDDNPFWCKQFVDAKVGEYDHTEVYIVPTKHFVDFLKERIYEDGR